MIVVADAGPLQYLVRIEAINVLPLLCQRVVVPQSVAQELQEDSTPTIIRTWIETLPIWCEIRPDPPIDHSLSFLDPGERAAIALAELLNADRLLMDEWEGRAEAKRRRLSVTGTLGVLAEAHLAGLLIFENALARLRQTNFYVSDDVIAQVRLLIAKERRL